MKNLKIVALILIALLAILQFFIFNSQKETKPSQKSIAVSTFALYDIAKHIAGESIKIVNIIPFGSNPHSFEPSPKLMGEIEDSSLLFYSGVGLEHWIENMEFKNRALDVSKHVKLRELESDEFEFHEHHDEQCAHGTLDPHYWLDFENMQKATKLITDELINLQPEHKEKYEKNRDKYLNGLKKLDNAFKKDLSLCRLNTIIINHNSISYLAHKYNFETKSLSGLTPEAEPTASDIKRIIKEIDKDGVKTIFFENFVNNSVIKSIAKDENIKIDSLHSLGNITPDEADQNLSYEDIMYTNLEKLSKVLECN
ncbi:zinc ABC transporter substrate-binding protein [Sulfurimonas aquatica]|uniref:Zinc ABC transporter substrate-binding protein n=1 Tax=Sulfurimonas aquatica TaxID=2672570 RepID=A0A975B2E6_9BACT|nr:metal ABC transporter substrate-binding protein [Sulfurimonas aquatica]QSZ42992.1 zinc ABC transporter substrate-binding protein [Sulfurimonas aquatica]